MRTPWITSISSYGVLPIFHSTHNPWARPQTYKPVVEASVPGGGRVGQVRLMPGGAPLSNSRGNKVKSLATMRRVNLDVIGRRREILLISDLVADLLRGSGPFLGGGGGLRAVCLCLSVCLSVWAYLRACLGLFVFVCLFVCLGLFAFVWACLCFCASGVFVCLFGSVGLGLSAFDWN